jgi:hypothetical protein
MHVEGRVASVRVRRTKWLGNATASDTAMFVRDAVQNRLSEVALQRLWLLDGQRR